METSSWSYASKPHPTQQTRALPYISLIKNQCQPMPAQPILVPTDACSTNTNANWYMLNQYQCQPMPCLTNTSANSCLLNQYHYVKRPTRTHTHVLCWLGLVSSHHGSAETTWLTQHYKVPHHKMAFTPTQWQLRLPFQWSTPPKSHGT